MQSVSFTPTAATTTTHVHAVRTRWVKGKYIYSEHWFIPALCKIFPMAALNVKNEQKVIKERGAFCITAVDTESFFLSHFTFLPAQPCVPVFCSSVSAADVDSCPVVSRAHGKHCAPYFRELSDGSTTLHLWIFLFFSNRGASAYFYLFFSLFPAEHFEAVLLLLLEWVWLFLICLTRPCGEIQ